ncbi:MAG TPA: hypothetical protein PLO37_25915 [Candidatus Hydrogenedentes bacterium]|nr:hypothetical protein [Candidatus Hydrogenedentota bacterium]HPG70294.1 hypothetical protein [Candidatus Hydrogenedentota bacterium]
MAIIAVLISACAAAFVQSTAHGADNMAESNDAEIRKPFPADTEAAENFIRVAGQSAKIATIECTKRRSRTAADARALAEIKSELDDSDSLISLTVDTEDHTVYYYSIGSKWVATEQSHLAHTRSLTAEEAFDRSVPVLAHYGLSLNKVDYEVCRLDTIPLVSPWCIERDLGCDGQICIGSHVSILISPVSGTIVKVTFRPARLPDERERKPRITKLEALARAEEWLRTHKSPGTNELLVDAKSLSKIDRVIALPNTFHGAIDRPEVTYPSVAHYCWQVPFRWTENRGTEWQGTFEGRLWISTYDGSIVGGDSS